jgi:hypothetical protein
MVRHAAEEISMITKSTYGRVVFFAAALAAYFAAIACGSDSNNGSSDGGTGGETETGGKTGTGGSGAGGKTSTGGSSSGGMTSTGGKGGTTSTGGTAGSTSTGGKGGQPPDGGTDGGDAGCVPSESLTPPTVPSAIDVPPSAKLLHHFRAEGTQNYTCTSSGGASPTYAWSAAVPDASLYDSCNNKVIKHSAGPTWSWLADTSAIKGVKIASSDVANAIPQLLLSAMSTGGAGELSNVKFVQRLDTTGGVAPGAGDCSASTVDTVKKVPYTATYYFYTNTPADAGADAGPK